ncbi:MAG: hypothetical protein IPP40_18520 [bacterium]|nr:hypothetical protein [bacterium]
MLTDLPRVYQIGLSAKHDRNLECTSQPQDLTYLAKTYGKKLGNDCQPGIASNQKLDDVDVDLLLRGDYKYGVQATKE